MRNPMRGLLSWIFSPKIPLRLMTDGYHPFDVGERPEDGTMRRVALSVDTREMPRGSSSVRGWAYALSLAMLLCVLVTATSTNVRGAMEEKATPPRSVRMFTCLTLIHLHEYLVEREQNGTQAFVMGMTARAQDPIGSCMVRRLETTGEKRIGEIPVPGSAYRVLGLYEVTLRVPEGLASGPPLFTYRREFRT